ncbi:MAG TPA: hypothetical protein VK629_22395 [Steroidobacteraceae bacterium]|nr:hypothetical protein [Steroidobacteraceae bacterium]
MTSTQQNAFNRILVIVSTGMALSCGLAAPAAAQSYLKPTPPSHASDDTLRFEIDLLYGGYDTEIQFNDDTAIGSTPGTTISGEEDLGLTDTEFLGQVELTLLPGEHHLVRFNGISMRRDGQTVLKRTIEFDNETYSAGERVDSFLNVSLLGLTYGYLPLLTDRYELGVTFGIQITSVSANAEVKSRVIRESDSGVAPLPLWGIEGRFDITRRWSIDARVQYITSSFLTWALDEEAKDDVEATIIDGRFAVRWRQNQHLIYGLGYRYFDIDIVAKDTDPSGSMKIGLTGPMLFIQASL